MSAPKPKVAFVCVHNSCRSQIAEALGRAFHGETFSSFSAGTTLKASINADAVRLVKVLYGIDMEGTQRPKLLHSLPPVDIIITMGCEVHCPTLPCRHREDWALDDPTGEDDRTFIAVIRSIEGRLEDLSSRIVHGLLE
ncbi:MAG TPA: arsenate reductase ArsC [Sphaerochaeta sp.]|nr:arsenate reductase ArsC [Sphaerochaeta sp.]